MDIKPTKLFGWIFIVLGLIVIFFTIFETMSYFKAEKEFPQVFVVEKQVSSNTTGTLDSMMQGLISDQMSSIIGEGTIEKMFNMLAWSMFAFLMIYAGAKVSDIGFKLVKKEGI